MSEQEPSPPDSALDAVFGASLGEFIAERNRLAQAQKEAGNEVGAKVTKALKKPALSAWAVNRLALGHADELSQLLDAGERQRAAQQSGDTEELAAAGESRRAAVRVLLDLAAAELTGDGHATGASTLQKIERTLEAVAVYGHSGLLRPPPGRLEREVEPPGFEVLATLASIAPVAKRKRNAAPSKKKEAKGRASSTQSSGKVAAPAAVPKPTAVVEAEEVERRRRQRELKKLEQKLTRAVAADERATAEHERIEEEVRDARSRVATLTKELESTKRALESAENAARRAHDAHTEAHERKARLKAQVEGLRSDDDAAKS